MVEINKIFVTLLLIIAFSAFGVNALVYPGAASNFTLRDSSGVEQYVYTIGEVINVTLDYEGEIILDFGWLQQLNGTSSRAENDTWVADTSRYGSEANVSIIMTNYTTNMLYGNLTLAYIGSVVNQTLWVVAGGSYTMAHFYNMSYATPRHNNTVKFYIDQAGTIVITDSAGADKPRSSPLNYNTCFNVNITDTGLNTDPGAVDHVNITVTSTTDSAGFNVTLNETGEDTGVFNILVNSSTNYAGIGTCINVSTVSSYDPRSGYSNYTIKVANNPHKVETITVSYDDAQDEDGANPAAVTDTIIMQQSAVAYWFNGGTGVAYFNSTYGDQGDTGGVIWSFFGIGVNDSGSDLNPNGVDNVTLDITTSSGENIQICVNESGDSTGVFNIQTPCIHTGEDSSTYPFNFELTLMGTQDMFNELIAVSGDNINLTLIGDTDFNGNTVDAHDLIWMDTLGQVEATATTALDPDASSGKTDLIDIFDNGTRADYSAIDYNKRFVTLYSYDINWNLLTTIELGFNESGADTGQFSDLNATVTANTTTSSNVWESVSQLHIMAREGGYINITYNDTANFSGMTPPALGPIKIDVYDKGELSFDYSGIALGTSDGNNLLFEINDSDLNSDASAIDTAVLILNSTSCPTGIKIGLNESGVDTGLFNVINVTGNNITFVTSGTTGANCSVPPTADKRIYMNVSAGDLLYVSYVDANPTGFFEVTSWMDQTGGLNFTDATGAVSATFYSTSKVYLNLTDAGKNTDNQSIDCVTVTINSTSNTTGIIIGLNETGANTGIFNQTVVDCNTRTAAPLTLATSTVNASNNLEVAEGDTVQVMYDDNKGFDGSDPAIVSETFTVQYTGTIELNKKRYHLNNDNVVITVTDVDNKTQTNITMVKLSSSADVIGINITLNRTDATNGIFSTSVADDDLPLNLTLHTGVSNSSWSALSGNEYYYLKAEAGGWVMANYTDGDGTVRTAKVRIANDSTPLSINATRFIPTTGNSYKITVNDMANNTNTAAADTIDIKVNSTADEDLFVLTATETGADTGIFEAEFTVSTSATSHSGTVIAVSSSGEQYIKAYYDCTLNSTGTNPSVYGTQAGAGVDPFEQQVGYYSASVALDSTNYNVSTTTSTAVFTVTDYDANVNNDAAETVTVYYTSDFNTTHMSFTATETGANTGLFRNSTITFDNLTTAGHAENIINAREGDTFGMWYHDTEQDGSTTTNVSDYATMNIRVTIEGGNSGGAGWDLISVPLTLADTSVSSAMQGVTYNVAYWYNPTSDAWETPSTLAPLKGYAIKVSSTQYAYFAPTTSTLDTSKTIPTLDPITLATGWNMIGINNLSSGQAQNVFTSLKSSTAATTPTWSDLYDWTGLQYTNTPGDVTSAKVLETGIGYWIYILEDATNRNHKPCGSGR